MADEVVGRAYVEIIPKVDKFAPALKSGTKASVADVERAVATSTNRIGANYTRAGQTASTAFQATKRRATTELGEVDGAVTRTARGVTTKLSGAGRSAGTAFQPVSRGAKKAEQDAKESSSKIGRYFQKTGEEIKGSFSRAAAGAAVGIAIFSFFHSSVVAASDLNETASKTATVFGAASDEVFKFASTAATSLGQSRQQAEEAVATFGNLLEGLKIAPGLAATMSIQLDKLASDFASFHNANPADVIESLTAAFRGEFDPVQKFVPTINAATVELEALKETGKQNAAALTLQEKGLATYNILLKGAGPALGDFARTSSGAANQGRILGAQFEDLKTKVGAVLLPALTATFRTLNSGIQDLDGVGRALQTIGHDAIAVGTGIAHALQSIGIHKAEVIGIATALGALYAGLKLVGLGKSAVAAIGTAFQALQAKVIAAGATVRGLGTQMTVVKLAALGLNIALGVVAIGVGILAAKHANAKARAEEHAAAVHTLAEALRESNGRITDAVRAQVALDLEQRGLLKTAQHLGIATNTYTSAVLGNKSAQDDVTAAIQRYLATSDDDVLTKQRNVAALGAQLGLYGEATAANDRLTTAIGGTATATDTHTTASKNAAEALKAEQKKAEELRVSLLNLVNVNLDAQSTHLQFQAAILALDGSLQGLDRTTRKQTLSLDGNTVAGNQARQTLIDNTKAALADYDAQLKRGLGVQKATSVLSADITALRDHYLKLGYNRQQVDSIITSLSKLAKQHPKPTITVQSDAARQKIAELQLMLDHLNGRKIKTYIYNFIENRTTAVGGGKLGGATGGVVGQSLGYRQSVDTELVWAQPGEGMVVPSAVKLLGGPAGIARLNRGLLPGVPVAGWSGEGGGGAITIMPGAVQVNVTTGGDAGDAVGIEVVVRRAVNEALASLVAQLRTGARR